MIGFGGANNLVTWIAIDKGLFAREGLKVVLDVTPGSREQMQNMMAGKYQFATTAFDNIVAYTEGEGRDKLDGFDIVAIMGAHNGFNSVVVRPEINGYADIKGKALAVDSPKSGYATMMYEIIRRKTGMVQDKDYQVLQVGGTGARVKALQDGAAVIAAISSPDDQLMKAAGMRILGDAALEIGAYQGSTYAVRRSWATANAPTVLGLHPRHRRRDRLAGREPRRGDRGAARAREEPRRCNRRHHLRWPARPRRHQPQGRVEPEGHRYRIGPAQGGRLQNRRRAALHRCELSRKGAENMACELARSTVRLDRIIA